MNKPAYFRIELDGEFSVAFDLFFRSFLIPLSTNDYNSVFRSTNRFFIAPLSMIRVGFPMAIIDEITPLLPMSERLLVRLDPAPILKAITSQQTAFSFHEYVEPLPELPHNNDEITHDDLILLLEHITSKYSLDFIILDPMQIPWWDADLGKEKVYQNDTEFDEPLDLTGRFIATESDENDFLTTIETESEEESDE